MPEWIRFFLGVAASLIAIFAIVGIPARARALSKQNKLLRDTLLADQKAMNETIIKSRAEQIKVLERIAVALERQSSPPQSN